MDEGRTELKGFDTRATTLELSILIDSTLKGQCLEIFDFKQICHRCSLIPVVHLDLRSSLRIFEEIRNEFRDLREIDS
jgi:hypothetical protein